MILEKINKERFSLVELRKNIISPLFFEKRQNVICLKTKKCMRVTLSKEKQTILPLQKSWVEKKNTKIQGQMSRI